MASQDLRFEEPAGSNPSGMRGSGWMPGREGERTPRAIGVRQAPADRPHRVGHTGRTLRTALMVLLGFIIIYTSFRVISGVTGFFFPSHSSAAVNKNLHLPSSAFRALPGTLPARRSSDGLSFAVSLSVDVLAVVALVWLRRGTRSSPAALTTPSTGTRDAAPLESADPRSRHGSSQDESRNPRPGYIRGKVSAFQTRNETHNPMFGTNPRYETIWTFVLERFNAAGERQRPVPVEMRARSFNGFVNDGDQVEIYSPQWRDGETVFTEQVTNLTTGATARGIAPSDTSGVIVFIMFVVWLGGLLTLVMS